MRWNEPKIRKPATLWESPAALHSTQSAMGLLHTVTATYLIIASEASRCVIDRRTKNGYTTQWYIINLLAPVLIWSIWLGIIKCYSSHPRFYYVTWLNVVQKIRKSATLIREPGSASQHSECKEPAPHYHNRLCDHGLQPSRYVSYVCPKNLPVELIYNLILWVFAWALVVSFSFLALKCFFFLFMLSIRLEPKIMPLANACASRQRFTATRVQWSWSTLSCPP